MFATRDDKSPKIKRPAFLIMLILFIASLSVIYKGFLVALIVILSLLIILWNKLNIGIIVYVCIVLSIIVLIRGFEIYSSQSSLCEYDDTKITFTAQLVSYPEYSDNTQAVFKIVSVNSVDWEREKVLVRIYSSDERLMIGGLYEITGTLKIARNASNPGGFDYKTYLSTKNIKAYVNVNSSDILFIEKKDIAFFYDDILQLRAWLDGVIRANLASDKAGLLSGVIFGESFMEEEILISFRNVGVAHVLAVSGLHCGIIYMFSVSVLRRLNLSDKGVFIAGLICLAFYCAITGFTPSVVRASVMLSLMSFASVTKRQSDSFNNLCLAAIFMLLINPMSAFSVSFQMSFCAAASIVLFVPVINAKLKPVKNKFIAGARSLLIISFTVQLALAPITIYYFNNINLITILANLLIIPVMSVVVIGGLIIVVISAVFPFASGVLYSLIDVVLTYLIEVTSYLASIKLTYFYVPSLRIRELVLLYFILFAFFGYYNLHKYKIRKYLFCAVFVSLFVWCAALYLPPFKTRLHFLDVGFGDCCIIRTKRGENIIIDGGGHLNNDTAKYDIIPFLEYYKINSIDAAIVTHSHSDHINGIIGLINYGIDIDTVYANEDYTDLYYDLISEANKRAIQVRSLYAGDSLSYEDVFMNVLLPYPDMPGNTYINNSSITILLSADDVDFLLLGDLEEYGLNLLLNTYWLSYVEVVKANHHGEYNQMTPMLYEYTSPNVCVISVGANNYSLPNEELFIMLKNNQVECYTTENSGMITFVINGDDYKITEYVENEF